MRDWDDWREDDDDEEDIPVARGLASGIPFSLVLWGCIFAVALLLWVLT